MLQPTIVITPPQPNVILLQHGLSFAIAALFGSYSKQCYTPIFYKQFIVCCTTKKIFWLGKNKFSL